MDAERRALELAARQCGVVRRTQLYALGIHPRTLHRRSALWQPHGRSVLVLTGTAPGLLRDSLVAAHAGHGRVALSGWSSLLVLDALGGHPWSAFEPEPRPWVRSTQHLRLAAKLIRRDPGNTTERLGVRTVPYAEAVSDILRFTPLDDARALAYRLAQHHGHARLSQLLAASVAAGEVTGNEQLRAIVADLATGAESDAEHELLRLLAEAGFTGFIPNHSVVAAGHRYRIDIAFPHAGLAIEVDGRVFHTDSGAFQRDRTRQNNLVAAGWRVLRFTWDDIVRRPEQTLATIAAHLA